MMYLCHVMMYVCHVMMYVCHVMMYVCHVMMYVCHVMRSWFCPLQKIQLWHFILSQEFGVGVVCGCVICVHCMYMYSV